MIAAVLLLLAGLVGAVVVLVARGRRQAADAEAARQEAHRARTHAAAETRRHQAREDTRREVQAETAARLERDPSPAEVKATLARIRRRLR
jgi:hypothetical protein